MHGLSSFTTAYESANLAKIDAPSSGSTVCREIFLFWQGPARAKIKGSATVNSLVTVKKNMLVAGFFNAIPLTIGVTSPGC